METKLPLGTRTIARLIESSQESLTVLLRASDAKMIGNVIRHG
jgi:hypothetical protein